MSAFEEPKLPQAKHKSSGHTWSGSQMTTRREVFETVLIGPLGL
ncbi:MAG: hypothetical protein GHCLOJNM_02991 [bacterium]|nr:hypothetical protein [bacterium]